MLQTPKLELKPFLNLALRRKWWIIIPFLLSILGGAGVLAVTPKTFKASTLILLEPQSIPDSFVKSTVMETVEGRLRTMTDQIQSRTNLEKIVRDFRLDQKASTQAESRVDQIIRKAVSLFNKENPSQGQSQGNEREAILRLVDGIRSSLQVTMRSGGTSKGQNAAFEISFEWQDPEIVAPIANAIASRFIEENINAREEVAMNTTDFLDKEATALRGDLEAREKELEAFKREHMGMLPDQLQANINILNQLNEQLQSLERRLDQERQQAMLIRSQAQTAQMQRDAFTSTLRQEQARQGTGTSSRREAQMSTEQLTSGSLEDLERELKRLSSLYTEQHPDILTLKRRIATLREEGRGKETDGAAGMRSDPSQAKASLQLAQINVTIESYKNQIGDVQKQVQIYKERVERTPQVEMALNKVIRDYQTVRERYDGLLAKKMDAKLAEQMEKRKKGEQFRILDSAIKPSMPFKPDPMRIMFMALAAGLGLGCGLAYLREMMDPAFYSPEELEICLGVPVITALPMADFKSKS